MSRAKYEVDKVLEKREGHLLYHVKWVGYKTLTWEPSVNFDEQNEAISSDYKVEKIMGQKLGGKEYLIKWKGYPALEWQPVGNLRGAKFKIDKFEEDLANDIEVPKDIAHASQIKPKKRKVEVAKENDTEKESLLDESNGNLEPSLDEESELDILRRQNREIKEQLAIQQAPKKMPTMQIRSCPCPDSCNSSCQCRVARLECWRTCGCAAHCVLRLTSRGTKNPEKYTPTWA